MWWNIKDLLLKLGDQQISVSLVGAKTEMILCNIKDLQKEKHFMTEICQSWKYKRGRSVAV